MSGVVEMLLDGKYTDLKEDIEQRIANKLVEKINTKKEEVIEEMNEGK